jgi:hypothetical protein
MKDILKIEVNFLLGRMPFSQTVDLGKTCQSRFDSQALALPHRVVFYSLGRFRARAYKAHFTSQNIEKLRKFSEAELRQKSLVTAQVAFVAVDVQPVHPKRGFVFTATQLFSERLSFMPT